MAVNASDVEDWGHVDGLWETAVEQVGTLVQLYREHREVSVCPHPTCTSLRFAQIMEDIELHHAAALLHAAVHRIETMRMEREAGL